MFVILMNVHWMWIMNWKYRVYYHIPRKGTFLFWNMLAKKIKCLQCDFDWNKNMDWINQVRKNEEIDCKTKSSEKLEKRENLPLGSHKAETWPTVSENADWDVGRGRTNSNEAKNSKWIKKNEKQMDHEKWEAKSSVCGQGQAESCGHAHS